MKVLQIRVLVKKLHKVTTPVQLKTCEKCKNLPKCSARLTTKRILTVLKSKTNLRITWNSSLWLRHKKWVFLKQLKIHTQMPSRRLMKL